MMIGFGCTPAPYYTVDPSCPRHEGRHHGIDMALACGTPLFAGVPGVVVPSDASGRLGAAYGPRAFRIRTLDRRFDLVIGHVRTVFVRPGQRVRRGQPIALAGDAGAPDGCHLHFEQRPAGMSYTSAVDPERLLGLRVVR
jgi:murein DD-endopeptidase MepM/ murein hydrolase activator NlpD